MVEVCGKCNGTGSYQYDHNHGTVCDACCPHDQGWWLLMHHYGDNNGKYCCKRGCGHTVWPSDLGIDVPEFVEGNPNG